MSQSRKSIRVVIAKPGLDGHDRGAKVLSLGLRDEGMEVIYTGRRQTPESIVQTAIQEDADVIGLSCLSGAHNYLFTKVLELLSEKNVHDVLLIAGGIIPEDDIPLLKQRGIAEVFPPGTKIRDVAEFIRRHIKRASG